MQSFEYVSPNRKSHAITLLGERWDHSAILAGGTDLLALMKDEILTPGRVVNIKDIGDLRGVSLNSQGLRIGALTTLADLADHPAVKNVYPALQEALLEAASPQIRNLATVGGNLCQRPRCWYFRNGFGLLPKDEKGKELVATGENRYHAILGNQGPAKFVSPSTIAPILIAYAARIRIEGPRGKREMPLEKFFVIPKRERQREHDLQPNEIVTEVVIPPPSALQAAHYEVRQKDAFDWPLAVASVTLRMSGAHVDSARVVLGYIAPVPWPSPEAEQVLVGRQINKEVAQQAADDALAGATPLSHNAYKVKLARVALTRAILKAAGVEAA